MEPLWPHVSCAAREWAENAVAKHKPASAGTVDHCRAGALSASATTSSGAIRWTKSTIGLWVIHLASFKSPPEGRVTTEILQKALHHISALTPFLGMNRFT